MEMAVAIMLGIVQGLTEFLPVSSSGHLALVPWILGVSDPGLRFDVALHLGTLCAVLAYTGRHWRDITHAAMRRASHKGIPPSLFWKLALASVPAAVAGVFLENAAMGTLRSPLIIAGTLAGVALLMAAADRHDGSRAATTLSWTQALTIGVAQAAALVPGVSRSGATMTAALFLGFSRTEAAHLSFLLAVPITAGAALFALRDLTLADITPPFIVGILMSGVTGFWAIRFLMRFLKQHTFAPFVVYRLGLAVAVVLLVLSRG